MPANPEPITQRSKFVLSISFDSEDCFSQAERSREAVVVLLAAINCLLDSRMSLIRAGYGNAGDILAEVSDRVTAVTPTLNTV